jgi:uncharacterized protein YndB with AHSA1/START domain
MATAEGVRHLTVTIARPPDEVYRFVADPANLPRWASGLGGSIEQVGGEWIAASPMGKVKVRFAPPNELGVLDHDVVLESGATFHNPLRVVPNGDGSEVTFTLFRWPGTSDAEHAADAAAVERDLRALRDLLERRGG